MVVVIWWKLKISSTRCVVKLIKGLVLVEWLNVIDNSGILREVAGKL